MKAFLQVILYTFLGVSAQAQISRDLDRVLREHTGPEQPGLALRVESAGRVLYSKGFGLAAPPDKTPVSSRTNFRMASVSKQFTAMAVLLLEQEGKLSLEDRLSKYFPEIPPGVADRIRIRHLLTHSSGIPDYESLMSDTISTQLSDRDVLELVKTRDTTYFEPGTSFRYSNSAYCLLSLLVERISGTPYPRFARDRIFRPLGMKNTLIYEAGQQIPNRGMGYARNEQGDLIPSDQSLTSATMGDGGVYTSLEDYSRWIHALRSNQLLQFGSLAAALKHPIREVPDAFYTAGWFIKGSSPATFFHSGSTCGFTNFVIERPEDGLSVVFFSNIAGNEAPFTAVLKVLSDHGITGLEPLMELHALTR
ncbi:MAG TPA: serine hydrolase domain-containing protein [Sphingobacteriaceae bacterium]